MSLQRWTRRRTAAALLVVGALGLSACSSGGTGSGSAASGSSTADAGAGKPFKVLLTVENTQGQNELKALAAGACSAENTARPLTIDTIPTADVNNRVTLLASQNALPDMFVAPTSEAKVGGDMYESGALLDLKKTLTDLGVWDDVLPAAASTVQTIYGSMVSMPFQYNVEGFWYNKQLFAKAGVSVPTTWQEFTDAAAKLKAAGVQPLTASGAQGWSLTRYISTYLARKNGVNALADVKAGKAKFTDPSYVEAAQQLADLGKAGYFGQGLASRDANTWYSDFLTGNAAMTYNGSWFLSNISDPKQDTVGVDNIGFFPFPAVAGGAGSINDFPANTGTVTAVSAKSYDAGVGAWLACIAKNYGSALLKDQGAISGFVQKTPVTDVKPMVQTVLDAMKNAKDAVIWLEAPFSQQFNDASGNNAASLVGGQISPQDYMAKLQAAVTAS